MRMFGCFAFKRKINHIKAIGMESDFVARSLIQCALPKCIIRIRLPQKALTFESFATEIKDTYLLVGKGFETTFATSGNKISMVCNHDGLQMKR